MGGYRNKQKLPAYIISELENEKISKKQGKEIENRMNNWDENNKLVFAKAIGGELSKIKFKNQKQEDFYNMVIKKEFTICKGTAGTGKTFLAVHSFLKLLLDKNNSFENIFLIKSVTPIPGEEIGFLKGSADDKLGAYMSSYTNVFTKFITESQYKLLQENKIIRELGIFQIRGWDISNALVIIDEAQNLSHHVMKTLMTRIGENCKLVILGDTKQIDLKKRYDSSLEFIHSKFGNFDEFGVFEFGLEDVVRNPVIQKIETIFDEREIELEERKKRK